jgi:hypothetical protein
MSDKSAHSHSSKKSGKSIKEKRAEKKAVESKHPGTDAVSAVTKH